MNGYVKTLIKCATALGLYHLAATFFVRHSNLFLLAKTRAITEAGFFAIPTPLIRPSLDSWEAALCGALFFTLTSGALALLTALVAPALHRLGILSRKLALGLHGGLLILFFSLLGMRTETTPLLLGAAGVYLVLLPSGNQESRVRIAPLLFHGLIPVILALSIVGTHILLPRGLFSGFRDAFLFDNPAGNAVRHFYYTYTLFPAEAFKSLNQKNQVTVNAAEPTNASVNSTLTRMGHIPLKGSPSDYTLTLRQDTVTLKARGAEHTVTAKEFFASPTQVFRQFSMKADPFEPLRSLTWYSLFTAFPLFFYLFFHTGFTLVAKALCPLPLAARVATVGVAAFAVFFVMLLAVGLSLPEGTQKSLQGLARTKERPPTMNETISRAADHPSALVRYRAALAAPRIREPLLKETLLTRLLNDRDINVVCQALGAMGQTRDRRYIKVVEEAVRTRPEWYVQWYGYRALRRLGWQPHIR